VCVCRSVCLSIVLCDCIKTVEARITKSSLSAATNLTWVSGSQKRCKMGQGLLLISYRKSHESFRSTPKSATLNNLETQNKGFISDFLRFMLQRTFRKWIAPKWLEIDKDNMRLKLSAIIINLSSWSFDFLTPDV